MLLSLSGFRSSVVGYDVSSSRVTDALVVDEGLEGGWKEDSGAEVDAWRMWYFVDSSWEEYYERCVMWISAEGISR